MESHIPTTLSGYPEGELIELVERSEPIPVPPPRREGWDKIVNPPFGYFLDSVLWYNVPKPDMTERLHFSSER
jgi:hypothetical protein